MWGGARSGATAAAPCSSRVPGAGPTPLSGDRRMSQATDAPSATVAEQAVVPRLSFSKLKRWEECPKNYWFHYFLRLPGLFGVWALLGTILHKTLEALEREAVAKGTPGHLSKLHAVQIGRAHV